MSKRISSKTRQSLWVAAALVGIPVLGLAQVPVDENGEPIGDFEPAVGAEALGDENIPLQSEAELQELVGPIALYPDDLLAVVLPASTYPLQVVQAARFLEDLETNPSLEPDETWDDSVVALINYPEVVELLNADLDWTWRLGEAVIAQQQDVVAAIETFRDRAYAAGNLQSDAHQTVARSDEGIIEIVPLEEDVIYVPYYEPERVVVYQPRPVYHYYPRRYPVYYYPYSSAYHFDRGYFWGVTTAFTIGWYTDRLHVHHHSYRSHPYYGRHYYDRWWYRRPTINIYNTTYVNRYVNRNRDYHRNGDYWYSRQHRRLRHDDRRITRNRYYPGDSGYETRSTSRKSVTRTSGVENATRNVGNRADNRRSSKDSDAIRFRERSNTASGTTRKGTSQRVNGELRDRSQQAAGSARSSKNQRDAIRFRDRSQKATDTQPTRIAPSKRETLRTDTNRNRQKRLEIEFRDRSRESTRIARTPSRETQRIKAPASERTARNVHRESKPARTVQRVQRESSASKQSVRPAKPARSESRRPEPRKVQRASAPRDRAVKADRQRTSGKSVRQESKKSDRRAGKKDRRD